MPNWGGSKSGFSAVLSKSIVVHVLRVVHLARWTNTYATARNKAVMQWCQVSAPESQTSPPTSPHFAKLDTAGTI